MSDVAGLVTGTSVVTALLLGVVGAVVDHAEFAFGTIRPTFAATPRRMRVLVAKGIVTAVFAAVAEALVVVVCFWSSSAIASSRGAKVSLDGEPEARAALIGIVVFAVIVSLLGFGLGLIIRNTPAAVAVLILWPLVVENIIVLHPQRSRRRRAAEVPAVHLGLGLGDPNLASSDSAQPRRGRSVLRGGDACGGR